MESMRLFDIARVLGGDCKEDCLIEEVVTDSRLARRNTLFIAIAGERFDGHDFCEQVLEKGCTAVVVERDMGFERQIIVESSIDALMQISKLYREEREAKIIGITGSVGKTTTKDIIAAVLSSKFETIKTPENQNNEIGLPKTIFMIEDTTETAVLEMGACDIGEIEPLSKVSAPDFAVVTNIGVSHIEMFKTRENIRAEKLSISKGVRDGGMLFLNGDDNYLKTATKEEVGCDILFYGTGESCDIVAKDIFYDNNFSYFTISYKGDENSFKIPAVGLHIVLNAAAAYAVAIELGLREEEIARGFESYISSGMRQKTYNHNGITIIEDCYNASPDSMNAALSMLKSLECDGRKIAVLGDMLELGEIAKEAHSEVYKNALQSADILVVTGEYRSLAPEFAIKCEDNENAAKYLLENAKKDDIILFKASRGVKLEEVVNIFKGGVK